MDSRQIEDILRGNNEGDGDGNGDDIGKNNKETNRTRTNECLHQQ